MIRKLKKAIYNPELIRPHLKWRYEQLKLKYIEFFHGEKLIMDFDGYKLYIDINKPGIDQELAVYGEREPISSEIYRNELSSIANKLDRVRVLEVGANIGYYALMPTAEIDDVEVFAVEVDEGNVDSLKKNILLNGVEKNFHIEKVALSDINGEADVYTHDASNLHSLEKSVYQSRKDKVKEINKTKTIRGDKLLDTYNLSEKDINVLRMDVEGHEAAILRGLPNILNHSPLLFHVELHPCYLNDDDIDYIVNRFADCDIVVACLEKKIFDDPDINKLMHNERYFELVGKF